MYRPSGSVRKIVWMSKSMFILQTYYISYKDNLLINSSDSHSGAQIFHSVFFHDNMNVFISFLRWYEIINVFSLIYFTYVLLMEANMPHYWIWHFVLVSFSAISFTFDFLLASNCTKLCTYFWTSFYKWWNNIFEFNIGRNDIFEECTLFGYPGEEDIIHILNYCVLLAQYLCILIN